MNGIEAWDNEDSKLIKEMVNFEADWQHRNPCSEYVKNRYCKHLESAQRRKFGTRVRSLVSI